MLFVVSQMNVFLHMVKTEKNVLLSETMFNVYIQFINNRWNQQTETQINDSYISCVYLSVVLSRILS